MREPNEIIINGKTLTDILISHKLWLDEDGGEEANPIWANLRGAGIDFSCWPLWCGSKSVKVDRKIAAQLAAHFCALDCYDPDYQAARAAILEFAKTSHRTDELGLIEDGEK